MVELASVEVLARKSWLCDAPGWPGCTIGSSGAVWVYRQTLTKLPWTCARAPPPGELCAPAGAQAATTPTSARAAAIRLDVCTAPPRDIGHVDGAPGL